MFLSKKICTTLLFLITSLFAFSVNAMNHSGYLAAKQPSAAQHLKTSLLQQYARWQGTPYDFGGTQRRGIDCSALMQKIFSRHITLPRTTHQQKRLGKRIGQHELRIGDLVFFKSSPRVQHVGVYIGDRQFIHASQKVGVTISQLDNPYWAPRFETARRVIE